MKRKTRIRGRMTLDVDIDEIIEMDDIDYDMIRLDPAYNLGTAEVMKNYVNIENISRVTNVSSVRNVTVRRVEI